MKTTNLLSPYPTTTTHIFTKGFIITPNFKRVPQFHTSDLKFPLSLSTSDFTRTRVLSTHTSSNVVAHDISSDRFHTPPLGNKSAKNLEILEENIEKVIYGCRFLAILAVWGSLLGSLLCFVKGCTYIAASYQEYMVNRVKVIMLLVEAIDIYLLGTVMLVFGMGLYELFISTLDKSTLDSDGKNLNRSSLFGLFPLKERPRWLEIKTVNELKTKLGHVIVMLLLIGLFEKSKIAIIQTPTDLLCFSVSILLCSCCLYLLSKLNH